MRNVREKFRKWWGKKKRGPLLGFPVDGSGEMAYGFNKMMLSEFIEERILPIVGSWPYPLDELLMMTGAICLVRPTKIFEWGTYIGTSARIFYETCRHYDIDAEIHSIDLPDTVEHAEHPHKERGRLVRGLKRVSLHQGDGVSVALSLLTEEDRRTGRILFFVDGDHAYASVKRELEAIVRDGCWSGILMHDTFHRNDPYRALQDVFGEREDVMLFSTVLGLPGMTLILPKKGV